MKPSLEKKVESEYDFSSEENRSKNILKKALLCGAAAVALSSCGVRPNNTAFNLYNFKVAQSGETNDNIFVGDSILSFDLSSPDATEVYLQIYGNGELILKDTLKASSNENEVYAKIEEYLDLRVPDMNLFPYQISIIATTPQNPSISLDFSTELTTPMPVFGRKLPELVSRLDDLLNEYVSTKEPEESHYYYFVDKSDVEDGYYLKALLYESSDLFLRISDGRGGILILEDFFQKHSPDATMMLYSVCDYHPFLHYATATVSEALTLANIEHIILDSSPDLNLVAAPLPEEIFKSVKESDDPTVHPLSSAKYFSVGNNNNELILSENYFKGETLSKEVLERYTFFKNRDDFFAFSNETGNLLAIAVDMPSPNLSNASVFLNSPYFFIGSVPSSEFYQSQEQIQLDDGSILNSVLDLPVDYKNKIKNALDEAEEDLKKLF